MGSRPSSLEPDRETEPDAQVPSHPRSQVVVTSALQALFRRTCRKLPPPMTKEHASLLSTIKFPCC